MAFKRFRVLKTDRSGLVVVLASLMKMAIGNGTWPLAPLESTKNAKEFTSRSGNGGENRALAKDARIIGILTKLVWRTGWESLNSFGCCFPILAAGGQILPLVRVSRNRV